MSNQNFDIKHRDSYKLYILQKDQITFESELLNKKVRLHITSMNNQISVVVLDISF